MHSKAAAALALLAAFSACSNDFSPYSRLDRLRILAVRADPATPAPGETCHLTALTFAPSGSQMSFQWSFCPVTAAAKDDYRCPISETAAREIFGDPPSFDLGAGEATAFTNTLAPEMLAGYCATGIANPEFTESVDCNPGFPVTVVLDALTESDALRAAFTISLPTPDSPANGNPSVEALSLDGHELANATNPLVLSGGKAVDFSVQLSADSVEMRPIPPTESGSGQRPERLTLSWFADAGDVDQTRTVYIDGTTTLKQATSNRWTPPASTSGTAHFAVVVRDDRGGVGWLSRDIQWVAGP